MGFIGAPMGAVLKWLMSLFNNNFAWAVFVFTVLVNLVMLPLTIKSQKSNLKQAKLRPKLEAIKLKYGDDKVKVQQATQELYSKEGVSPAGGCLPMILRLVFMMGVYEVIRKPLTYIAGFKWADAAMAAEKLEKQTEVLNKILGGAEKVGKHVVTAAERATAESMNFNWLGINLTDEPKFNWNFSEFEIIWLIPILAFAAAMLNSIVTLLINKKMNPDQPNMAGMMLTMPLISLFFAFSLEGAVGFYWIVSSIISGAIQAVVSVKYNANRLLAIDRMKSVTARYNYEKNMAEEQQ